MNKAILTISTIDNFGRLIDYIPGIKLYAAAEEDFSYLKVNYKNENEIIVIDLKSAIGKGMDFLHNTKISNYSSLVIVITNLNNDDFRNRCQKLGADYFFDKEKEIKEFSDIFNKQIKTIINKDLEIVELI